MKTADQRSVMRPYDLDADKQHGPGEGRAGLLHHAVAREERDEPALGPAIHVAGGVAEVAPVRAARHVEAAPERLARNGDEQVASRHPGHLGERGLRLRDMLKHLDRACELEL